MNVDFGNEQSLAPLALHDVGSSFIHMSDDSQQSQSHSGQGGSVQTEGNNAIPAENAGNLSSSERLVMPKRPHNVTKLIYLSYVVLY